MSQIKFKYALLQKKPKRPVIWCRLSTYGVERQGHEDALVSGSRREQPELGSPVIHQVKLHVPAAPQQLPASVWWR